MIIFLYGPDSYRRQQKQREIIEKYKAKHSALTIDRFDLDEEGAPDRLKEFLEARSLFGGKKLAIISGWDDQAAVLDDESLVLLVSTEKGDPPKGAKGEEFKNLEGAAWEKFINQQAVSRQLTLSPQVINGLVTAYQGDSWGLITELDQLTLCNFQLPIFNFQLRYDFIDLIKQISWKGDLSTKIPALEILLHNEDPGKIFNLLAAFTGSSQKIQMADYDVAVKSGKLDYEAALIDFVLN